MTEPWIIDTHAHLSDEKLWGHRREILLNARSAGVGAVVSVGYDRITSERALQLSVEDSAAAPTVGIHPTSVESTPEEDYTFIALSAANDAVVAIGETGLDFYWDTTPHERQRIIFRWHIELALRYQLPLTIHSRNAENAVLDEIETFSEVRGAMHCFGGDQVTAKRALDAGLYLGFGGPITFRKSRELHELVQWMPADRLLLETDSPYLSPEPYRGATNEPARVSVVAARAAELRGVPLEEIQRSTTANALALFPRLRGRYEGPE